MTKKPCTSPVLAGLPPNNSPIAVLADVRTGNHWVEGFDRVVFDFRDDTSMPGFSVRYVDKVLEDPSGIPVPMLPGAKLLVSMRLATAHEHGVSTVPPGDRDLRPDLPRVRQVKVAGDYEGMLTYGIAVGAARGPAAFRAHALTRNRLVIDVAHARTRQQAWFCGQVYFADQRKLVDGTDPPVTAVERRLAKPAVAGAAMTELFRGPNLEELDRELLFVPSHATGFTDLRVSRRIAHIRLLGPITSGGSTITIANQIMPTLKQFPTVEWVKIYDEDGKTQHPDGPVDSIPYQLEP